MIAALAAAALCALGPVPDNTCTPGTYDPIPLAAVCTSKRRPDLSDYDRSLILNSYGVPRWTGRDGELDHRVPFYLGGHTDSSNVWPEPGPIPNAKDRLEAYTYSRVCQSRTMRPTTARRLFLRDWRTAARRYHLPTG
jgi:hypothetical protein